MTLLSIVLYLLFGIVFSTEYEVTIDYDGDDPLYNYQLCASHVIPRAPVPFETKQSVIEWLNKLQMCYFAFINDVDEAIYARDGGILSEIATKDTSNCQVCWDTECINPLDKDVVKDLNILSGYVDIHEQSYNVDEFTPYTFRINGIRKITLDDGIIIADFANNIEHTNEFQESFELNLDGTLKKRTIISMGHLAQKLKDAAGITYLHFAQRVVSNLDIPERLEFVYKDVNGEDRVYYVHLNNIVVILVLIMMICIVLFSFCWTTKLVITSLCCRGQKVHSYSKVNQQTDSEN